MTSSTMPPGAVSLDGEAHLTGLAGQSRARCAPLIGTPLLRFLLGTVLAFSGPFIVAALDGAVAPDIVGVMTATVLAWLPAVWLTDKYRHKYAYRYDSYLIASHLKAAVVVAVLLVATYFLFRGLYGEMPRTIVKGFALASLVDLLVMVPRRRKAPPVTKASDAASPKVDSEPLQVVHGAAALNTLGTAVDEPMRSFLAEHLPATENGLAAALAVEDRADFEGAVSLSQALVVGKRPVNAVSRLNLYLQDCAASVVMGGYLALHYTPLEENLALLRARFPGPLYGPAYLAHFVWYRAVPKLPYLDVLYFSPPFRALDRIFYRSNRGRRRVLARPEVWGRLAYYGFEVIREEQRDGTTLLLARRTTAPVANRRPSYYAVVALEKVGLDGDVIRLYKVRSMFPFSEFLQKRIFETHGLGATGKFNNDFRLTEYGPLIRRSWLDELPGLVNWLRGDVKLVGMRATSPHFLGLYPAAVRQRYSAVKPGLVPPIFDEKTAGFEQIVEIEDAYLRRYLKAPVRTDIAYFWYTFRDIFIRRVRSK